MTNNNTENTENELSPADKEDGITRRYSVNYVDMELDLEDDTIEGLKKLGLQAIAENEKDLLSYAITHIFKTIVDNDGLTIAQNEDTPDGNTSLPS